MTKYSPPPSSANICFSCQRACGKCPWSAVIPGTDELAWQPVPGWTAEKTMIKMCHGEKGHYKTTLTESYHITTCPLYLPDPPERLAKVKPDYGGEGNWARTFY